MTLLSQCRTFVDVVKQERIQCINQRRKYWQHLAEESSEGTNEKVSYPETDGKDLVGVALSGGGIRSAMFNLGLLQALHRTGFMKHVDYLSSVSGGGYTNGYYSTLGHFGRSLGSPSVSPRGKHHSNPEGTETAEKHLARDAQFLLDGQYLNRPIEFLTDYLIRTSRILFAAVACLLAFASLICLYFRFFDHPGVRRWLELLDISTDLQVGLFATLLLCGSVLSIRWLVRKLRVAFGGAVAPAPGQWVVISIGIFLLGIAVMIGNGDFFISNGQGFLPEKLDFQAIQVPMTIAIILLFSPMLRLSTLLQSEKVNATIWQRIALAAVLFGTTWGAVLATVGWIGKENISGFATSRSPKFENQDIINYGELARLLQEASGPDGESSANPTSSRSLRNIVLESSTDLESSTVDFVRQLNAEVECVLANERTIIAKTSLVRPEGYEWDRWLDISSQAFSRWVGTVLAATSASEFWPVHQLIKAKKKQFDIDGPKLSKRVEDAINPAAKLNSSVAATRDAQVFHKAPSRTKVTYDLLELAARRIRSVQENDQADARKATNVNNVSLLMQWVESGGKMFKKDQKPYRDLAEFNVLLRQCWQDPYAWDIQSISDLDEWRLNRMLLEIAYPGVFKERVMISTSVVVAEDQNFRWMILIVSSIVGLVGLLSLDLNRCSAWFHFYRKRIGETFLKKADKNGVQKLSCLNPTKHGYPFPLFVSGLILPQAPKYSRELCDRSDHANPTKLDGSFASNWYSFVFSPLYCGWLPMGASWRSQLPTYRKTETYLQGELKVDQAVVLSGAAMTPFMSENRSLRLLMHLFNIRLEQWLPNPNVPFQPRELRFSLIDLAREWMNQSTWFLSAKSRPAQVHDVPANLATGSGTDAGNATETRVKLASQPDWRFGVVADGGFREFLGVEELIARRCKIVLVSDAGCNNGLYEFGVLAELIRKLRLDHNIEVFDLDHDRPLDTRRLRRSKETESHSPQHFVLGRIRYPEKVPGLSPCDKPINEPIINEYSSNETPNEESLLVYLQMSLTGDEDIDIEQFRRTNPNFPDEPISNQFYSRDQVESFRQLGEHIGELLCRDVSPFDCPSSVIQEGKSVELSSDRIRETRIRLLEDAFRSSYRNECRQESTIATDDAKMGWMMSVDHIENETLHRIHRYETNTEHQLLVRDFVWHCLDDYDSVRKPQFKSLLPEDLFGIAIECNRRHAGFRPEWPTAFFQVTGRDNLVRATQVSRRLLLDEKHSCSFALEDLIHFIESVGTESACTNMEYPSFIEKLGRLAVMLPRSVFRLAGVETGADMMVCLFAYLTIKSTDSANHALLPLDWIRREAAQRILKKAILTGKSPEVSRAICRLIRKHRGIGTTFRVDKTDATSLKREQKPPR